jgi:hypothetical protein
MEDISLFSTSHFFLLYQTIHQSYTIFLTFLTLLPTSLFTTSLINQTHPTCPNHISLVSKIFSIISTTQTLSNVSFLILSNKTSSAFLSLIYFRVGSWDPNTLYHTTSLVLQLLHIRFMSEIWISLRSRPNTALSFYPGLGPAMCSNV